MNIINRLAKLEAIAAQKRQEAQAAQKADERDVLERVYRLLGIGAIAWVDGRWQAGPTVADDDRFGKDMAKLADGMNSGPRFTATDLLAWAEQELGRDAWEARRLAEVRARFAVRM